MKSLTVNVTAELFSPSSPDVMRDFSRAFQNLSAQPTLCTLQTSPTETSIFVTRVHNLKPLTRILLSPPHLILSQLAKQVNLSLYHEAKILRLLSHFLSHMYNPCGNGSPYTSPYGRQWIVSTPTY